jgi:nicotinate phosphoribosyltransferase
MTASRPPDRSRFQPAADVLSGDTADVYFERAQRILAAERLDPVVTMEIFPREDAILCGAEEALAYLGEILGNGKRLDPEPIVESLHDGDRVVRKEIVMRIMARYSAFGLYETALLGILAQGTGWATAARRIVEVAAPIPVVSFGARHVHPSVADQMDYASVVGGCVGASTPAGARLAGLSPTGTMPHALILIFGDTVRAAEAFDRHTDPEVPRIVLVDTFKDEAEESLRVADALGERLWGVRLDTPAERGRVTPDLVKEVRSRLDQAGHGHVRVDSFAVGSAISDASPIDFTGDLKEIDGQPIAKRGRIPGRTENPRLARIDLGA